MLSSMRVDEKRIRSEGAGKSGKPAIAILNSKHFRKGMEARRAATKPHVRSGEGNRPRLSGHDPRLTPCPRFQDRESSKDVSAILASNYEDSQAERVSRRGMN
jgi:hypothetical protein